MNFYRVVYQAYGIGLAWAGRLLLPVRDLVFSVLVVYRLRGRFEPRPVSPGRPPQVLFFSYICTYQRGVRTLSYATILCVVKLVLFCLTAEASGVRRYNDSALLGRPPGVGGPRPRVGG